MQMTTVPTVDLIVKVVEEFSSIIHYAIEVHFEEKYR